jgi:hypothetical protein
MVWLLKETFDHQSDVTADGNYTVADAHLWALPVGLPTAKE